MTPYEVFFVIFATAFALKEYTASQEHGLDGKFCHSCDTTASEFTLSPNVVYLANVRRYPNNGSALS